MLNTKLIEAFKANARIMLANTGNDEGEILHQSSKKVSSKYKRLANQFMINEYGFDYLHDLEFNDDIANTFAKINSYVNDFTERELKKIKLKDKLISA